MPINLNNQTLPFACKDQYGDTNTIILKMPDGRYLGYFTRDGGSACHAMAYDAEHNRLVPLKSTVDKIEEWFHDSKNGPFYEALKAFFAVDKKINGIQFIRAIVPREVGGYVTVDTYIEFPINVSLKDAKDVYERMYRKYLATK